MSWFAKFGDINAISSMSVLPLALSIPYLFGLALSLRLAPSLGLAPPRRLQILISTPPQISARSRISAPPQISARSRISAPSSFFVIKRLFVWLAFNFSFSNSFTIFIIFGSTQNNFFYYCSPRYFDFHVFIQCTSLD